MKLNELNPELQSVYRLIPNTPISSALGRALVRAGTGAMKAPAAPKGVTVEMLDIPDAEGVIDVAPTAGGTGRHCSTSTAAGW